MNKHEYFGKFGMVYCFGVFCLFLFLVIIDKVHVKYRMITA